MWFRSEIRPSFSCYRNWSLAEQRLWGIFVSWWLGTYGQINPRPEAQLNELQTARKYLGRGPNWRKWVFGGHDFFWYSLSLVLSSSLFTSELPWGEYSPLCSILFPLWCLSHHRTKSKWANSGPKAMNPWVKTNLLIYVYFPWIFVKATESLLVYRWGWGGI